MGFESGFLDVEFSRIFCGGGVVRVRVVVWCVGGGVEGKVRGDTCVFGVVGDGAGLYSWGLGR